MSFYWKRVKSSLGQGRQHGGGRRRGRLAQGGEGHAVQPLPHAFHLEAQVRDLRQPGLDAVRWGAGHGHSGPVGERLTREPEPTVLQTRTMIKKN